jgi:hypothetical protein
MKQWLTTRMESITSKVGKLLVELVGNALSGPQKDSKPWTAPSTNEEKHE